MIDRVLARMRIRRRLILGFGCLLLLTLMVGLGVLAHMDRLDERSRAGYEQPLEDSGNPVFDLVVQLDQPIAQEQRRSGATAWRAE